MACRFLLVLLAVAAMTAQAAAQNADSMLPPPSPLPNTKAPGATTAPPIQDTITPVAATSELTLPAQPSGLGVVDRCWFNASYMLGWTTPTHLPPLVTTSPAGTPQASAGVFGVAGTSVITGDRALPTTSSPDSRWAWAAGATSTTRSVSTPAFSCCFSVTRP